MDVKYSDNVTNTIKNLRENTYSSEKFKQSFSDNLKKNIGATDVSFVPDKFGGWLINAKTDNSNNKSMEYVHDVTSALTNSIHDVTNKYTDNDIACNLANVIVTGPDTIVIKL